MSSQRKSRLKSMIEYQIYVRDSLIDNTPICLFRVVLITFSYSLDENVVTDRLSGKKNKKTGTNRQFFFKSFVLHVSIRYKFRSTMFTCINMFSYIEMMNFMYYKLDQKLHIIQFIIILTNFFFENFLSHLVHLF